MMMIVWTHTRCRTEVDKNRQNRTPENVVQGIEAGRISGLQTLFATALKTEP